MAILGTIASSTRQGQTTDLGAMYPLQVVTVGAPISSVTFTNIPQTYAHLQIRCFARSTTNNSNLFYKLNNDNSNTNYNIHIISGDGATASAVSITSGSANSFILANECVAKTGETANVFGNIIIDILDYSNSNKYKTTRALGGRDANGAGGIALTSNLWRNTASVTSISLNPDTSGSFVQYSQFALYGVKSA